MTILGAMDNAIKDIDSGRFKDDPETEAELRGMIGEILESNGKYDRAKPLLEQALAIRERLFKADDLIVAESLNSLGVFYYRQGQGSAARAEALLKRALAIYEKVLGPDHLSVAYSLSSLSSFYFAYGQHTQAGLLKTRALAILEKVLGPDDPHVASSMSDLAMLYQTQGRYAQAEPLLARALAIHERAYSPDHLEVLRTKVHFACFYWSQLNLDKSIPLFEEVLKVREAKLGRGHPLTLTTVGHLGSNYRDAGRLEEAIPLLEESYRASKQHPNLEWFGGELLSAYTKAADASKPESTARIAALVPELLVTARSTWPKDSPELALELVQFGRSLLTIKAWDEAEPLIRECLAIREKTKPDDWTTFDTRSMLGGALLGQNKLAEAELLLLDGYRGIKERESDLKPRSRVRLSEALERLVLLYEATGNETEAAAWRSELEAARAEQGKLDAKGGEG
jgi:tetratricopeptide (TPR) repeat protein